MSWLHFHLLINHFPVIGAWFLVIFLIIALRWKNPDFNRIIYGLFIALAFAAYASLLSGQHAEHQLHSSGLPFQSMHDNIELHEAAAAWTWLAFLLAGILALIGLLKVQASRWLIPVLLILSLGMTALSSWTALLGGMIIHTEIRDEPVSRFAEQIHLPKLRLGGKHRQQAKQSGDD